MFRCFALILLLFLAGPAVGQAGPEQGDLHLCRSDDGTHFDRCTVLVDSAGVPSMTLDASGRIVLAYQWFPDHADRRHRDSVAVSFSDDLGETWSDPHPVTLAGADGWTRPFDPTVVTTEDGRYRMYFSTSPDGSRVLSTEHDTYSGISDDGINYTLEGGFRFRAADRAIIDPAVALFNGTWYYSTPIVFDGGIFGAFRATSSNGLGFMPVAPIQGDTEHNWTGNYVVVDGRLRFYGAGRAGTWWAESEDGVTYGDFVRVTGAGVGDPAVLELPDGTFLMVGVIHRPTDTAAHPAPEAPSALDAWPNPFADELWLRSQDPTSLVISDLLGRRLLSVRVRPGEHHRIVTSHWVPGVYFVQGAGQSTRLLVHR